MANEERKNAMNKADLVKKVHASGNYSSRAAAAKAIDDVLAAVVDGVSEAGRVQLAGFGTFSVKARAARRGRNPRTGKAINIGPSKGVSFKAGKGLKERL